MFGDFTDGTAMIKKRRFIADDFIYRGDKTREHASVHRKDVENGVIVAMLYSNHHTATGPEVGHNSLNRLDQRSGDT